MNLWVALPYVSRHHREGRLTMRCQVPTSAHKWVNKGNDAALPEPDVYHRVFS